MDVWGSTFIHEPRHLRLNWLRNYTAVQAPVSLLIACPSWLQVLCVKRARAASHDDISGHACLVSSFWGPLLEIGLKSGYH